MNESKLQQFIYSPLHLLFLAAARSDKERSRDDESITSSLSVRYKSNEDDKLAQESRLTVKVDRSVNLHEDKVRWDPYGMMKIQRYRRCPDLTDYDICSLMTSLTAIAIQRCMKVKQDMQYNQVAIPFIVGVGGTCSLFATTLDSRGIPSIQVVEYPSGRNGMGNHFDGSSYIKQSEVFTAFGVLLNKFKLFFMTNRFTRIN